MRHEKVEMRTSFGTMPAAHLSAMEATRKGGKIREDADLMPPIKRESVETSEIRKPMKALMRCSWKVKI